MNVVGKKTSELKRKSQIEILESAFQFAYASKLIKNIVRDDNLCIDIFLPTDDNSV